MATVTDVVTSVVTKTVTSASPTSISRAAPQGGVFDGGNPSKYDPKNPIIMFIIQAGIVITLCRLLHWPLSKIRQPRVIAEVIAGVILGPSVMGHVPGFTKAIFPTASIPNFTLVANLGLVLFLFLVGLEVDLRYLVSNYRVALSVGLGGMALPFGLGCAISVGLYKFNAQEGVEPVSFGVFMLFIAIALAITAFPVLCRILTELKLLGTPVGIIVLSAGVGNDVVGWILLALCVALVNAGSGITALYVLLTAIAFTLFLVFAVRPAFMLFLNKTRSLQDGPSQTVVAVTLLIALASAFFTGVIGIHPIFGAFLAGLICPHEGGFAIKLTEKIEDLVSTLFLPLYFALSGLSTNLSLLDTGTTWGYVVGVTAVAFFAKVIGGSGGARLNGLVWRECFAIGSLMSCKGLIELIVLNIGLQAKILSTKTFTIFVVMALLTTFATTPLVAALYPPWYQKKIEAWKRGEIDWDTGLPPGQEESDRDDTIAFEKAEGAQVSGLLVYLRIDTMPGLLALTALFGGANESMRKSRNDSDSQGSARSSSKLANTRALNLHGVRLLPLTERNSSVMKVSEAEEYSAFDPIVNTFRAFGRLNSVQVSGEVIIVPETYYADTLSSRASDMSSDLLLLPWSETGSLSEFNTLSSAHIEDKMASKPYHDFTKGVLAQATCHTAIFVNSGFGGVTKYGPRRLSRTVTSLSMRSTPENAVQPIVNQTHHVYVPFFGSPDDRVAVRFVLQLVLDARLTVTIVHFKASGDAGDDVDLAVTSPVARADGGKKDHVTTNARESIPLQERNQAFLVAMRASLPLEAAGRVNVESVDSEDRVTDALVRARSEVGISKTNAGDLVVVGRNGAGAGEEASCLGPVGDAVIRSDLGASLLVVQARRK